MRSTITLPAWMKSFSTRTPNRRVKTPTVLQMERVECGAAALGIVLAYYGLIVPLEELRIATGVSRNGSKADHLLKAARRYGCEAVGYRKSIEKLKEAPLPAIIFWNFNHFLVLEGFGPKHVYINDPAHGPMRVSYKEFSSSFTGVTLIITPGPNFKPGGKNPSLVQALAQRLRGSRPALLAVLLLSLCVTLLGIILPSFSRMFIDQFGAAQRGGLLPALLLGMGGTALGLVVFTWLQQHFLLRLETKLALAGSGKFFWHILRLPIEFFQQRQTSDVSVRVGINDQIARLLSGEVSTNLLNVILILFYVMVMLSYSSALTFVGIAIALLNIVGFRYLSRRRVDATQRLRNEQGKLVATTFQGLQMLETLKATGSESDFYAHWAGHQAKVINAQQETGTVVEILGALPSILSNINVTAIIFVGSLQVINGQLSLGALVAFQALTTAFLFPINQLVSLGDRMQQAQVEMTRMDDVMRYAVDPAAKPAAGISGPISIRKLAGQIELRNVTFGYSRLDPPLIKDFSLTLKPGARVALVGGTGSGKTTIAKLIAGVYAPWSGEILFDGRPRDGISYTQLKNSLALVDQDIHLFGSTVRENITMWNPTVPEASVIQAAKDALIHEEIVSRPGGYDELVAEGGANFSGGQRQRLEIARALVTNPSILVLDEATSALDSISEKLIDDHIRRRGCTCVIVAHRLSTVRDCDEIIVLEKGVVVERGTHDKLLRAGGAYTQLVKGDESMELMTKVMLDLM
jgi:NHLM bacteriocin system ABC transporter peptidase/ATP-binding protein